MTGRQALRIALWLGSVALAVFVIIRISSALNSTIIERIMETHASLVGAIVFAALGLYTVLIAIPFVPGAEVGMALLSTFGAAIAVEVYLATVLGLLIGYWAGRLIPVQVTARALNGVGLTRAGRWLDSIAELPPEEIAHHILDRVRPGVTGRLMAWRYVALIVLINMPGNIVFGGGGGIALAAGLSRLFSPLWFLVAVLIAVVPVPLGVLLMGSE